MPFLAKTRFDASPVMEPYATTYIPNSTTHLTCRAHVHCDSQREIMLRRKCTSYRANKSVTKIDACKQTNRACALHIKSQLQSMRMIHYNLVAKPKMRDQPAEHLNLITRCCRT